MPKIRVKLESLNAKQLSKELKDVDVKIGIFGGRYYTLKDHKGALSLKKIIQISENALKKKSANAVKLATQIENLDEKGEEALKRVNFIRKFFTKIKRALGNKGFDKDQAIKNIKDLAPPERPPAVRDGAPKTPKQPTSEPKPPRQLSPSASLDDPKPSTSGSQSSRQAPHTPAKDLKPSTSQNAQQPSPQSTSSSLSASRSQPASSSHQEAPKRQHSRQSASNSGSRKNPIELDSKQQSSFSSSSSTSSSQGQTSSTYRPLETPEQELEYARNFLYNGFSEEIIIRYLKGFGCTEKRIKQILDEVRSEVNTAKAPKRNDSQASTSGSISSGNPAPVPSKSFSNEHNRRIQYIVDMLNEHLKLLSEEDAIRLVKEDADFTDEEIREALAKRSMSMPSSSSSSSTSSSSSSSSSSSYAGYPPSVAGKSDSPKVSRGSQRRAKHPLQKVYAPKSATFVNAPLLNQFTVGHPSGCTHFAAAFCDLPVNKSCSEKDIENILNRNDLDIVPGVNGFADEVLVLPMFENIELLPGDLYGYAFALQDADNLPADVAKNAFYKALTEKFQELIDDMDVDAFVITTGTESLGVRLLNNKDVELFDSHGASDRRDCPAVVWTFSKEDAAQKIAKLIDTRVGEGFIGQLSLFPIRQGS